MKQTNASLKRMDIINKNVINTLCRKTNQPYLKAISKRLKNIITMN